MEQLPLSGGSSAFECRPFTIDIPEADLHELRRRLEATRWPEPIPATGWEYGVERGYLHLQMTTPDTVAFALEDSPVGQLAWIVEKLRGWADCGGDVERVFSRDLILTHVSLYWLTRTMASANRLYYEARRHPLHLAAGERVQVPCGVAHFAREEPAPPRQWVERGYDLRHWTEFPRGDHFPAMEQPELLVQDIREFFRPLRVR